jgi:phage terminase large subunit
VIDFDFDGTNVLKRNLLSTARITINRGGTRSSKSYSLIQLLLIKALLEKKKKFLFLRKTFPSLRISSITDFQMIASDMGIWPLIRAEKQMNNYWLAGNLIHFDSLDKPEKKKSTSWNYIFFEEMPDFTFDDFKTMQLYLSAHPGPDGISYEVSRGIQVQVKNQIYGALNPIDEYCWVKTELLDKETWDTNEIVSTYLDNINNLHPDVVKAIRDLEKQDHNFYLVYTLGKWGKLENIIYSNWSIIPRMDLPNDRQIIETIYGVDFGYSHPAAIVRIDFTDSCCYEQELLYQAKLTPDQFVEKALELIPYSHRDKYIFCDNAEPATIEMMCNAGLNAYSADKDVRNGINCVKMQDCRITEDSVNLIKEKRGYAYKKDKDGRVIEGEPIKFNDHAVDAERYAIYTYLSQFGSSSGEIFTGGSAVQ